MDRYAPQQLCAIAYGVFSIQQHATLIVPNGGWIISGTCFQCIRCEWGKIGQCSTEWAIAACGSAKAWLSYECRLKCMLTRAVWEKHGFTKMRERSGPNDHEQAVWGESVEQEAIHSGGGGLWRASVD